MNSLNCGCGGASWIITNKLKDVNVDIEKPKKIPQNFILCDLHFLPFKEKTFNEILMKDVIEHLENPLKVLKELNRVYKKGFIVIITPNSLEYTKVISSFVTIFNKSYFPYKPHFDHSLTWGKPELLSLFKKAGFNKFNISFINNNFKSNKLNCLRKIIPNNFKSHLKAVIFE